MIQIIKSYFKFLLNSKNEHGIHSPFVFDLVTKCFYDKTNYYEYENIIDYKKSLIADKTKINVTDFGAGSRVFKTNQREVSKIAKVAGISTYRAKLLFRLINYFQPSTFLELGTSLGIATYSASIALKNTKIISVEGCKETSLFTSNKFLKCFNLEQLKNINFINSEFEIFLHNFDKSSFSDTDWNMVYFDGNHSKVATLKYFDILIETTTNKTIWIFDDIHWSKDMEEAWEIIKNHPKVTVTIDTFQWGIVFFRTEQTKEHFIINPNKTISSHLFERIRI
ncbi:class I SAM-dependent methyltransferase [Flavobacterium filum]|uniref:class I SAM-dependent methyltransferase n=1 Tax=Flavobacterium filum TaxID=370974 RepID=UPI000685EA63|nr:class I SAM-dependent methyltransferase [Flavobacterium filum]